MFTGIIEHKGVARNFVIQDSKAQLEIVNPWTDIVLGESIAVNGICLTVKKIGKQSLCFDLSQETLNITKMRDIKKGDCLNLERAIQGNARLGGHYVSGHVDCTAIVERKIEQDNCLELTLSQFKSMDAPLYLFVKGSISVDGVSLTINHVEGDRIGLMLIPHTILSTNLGNLSTNSKVNIEFDYVARIIAHQMRTKRKLEKEVQL